MTESEPNIYSYVNYREFLRDFYQFKKEHSKNFSYRAFSKACGFSSPNVLKLVMEGERNIGSQAIQKFCVGLEFSHKKADYFETLVQMNQAKSHDEQMRYFNKLKGLLPYSSKRTLNEESVEYYSHWLYPVIREMVELGTFKDDPYWLVRRLRGRTNVKEVQKALRFLIKNKFIEKNGNGDYQTGEQVILSKDEVKNFALRSYYCNILNQGKEVLEDIDIQDREFGSLIIALPQDAVFELKSKLKKFRSEIHQWALEQQKKENPQVIQLNFQMYPQSVGKGKK